MMVQRIIARRIIARRIIARRIIARRIIARPPIEAGRMPLARFEGDGRARGRHPAVLWWLLMLALVVVPLGLRLGLRRLLPAHSASAFPELAPVLPGDHTMLLVSVLAGACLLAAAFAMRAWPTPDPGARDHQRMTPRLHQEASHWAPGSIPTPGPARQSQSSGGPVTLPHRRIIFLVNARDFGGASQHSLNIASELQHLGLSVLLVGPPGSPAITQARARGLPTRELRLGLNVGRWRGVLGTLIYLNPLGRRRSMRLLLALHREQPSVFICPFPREQLLTTSLHPRHDLQSVWVVHAPFRYPAHRLLLQRTWIRRASRAQAVVTVSKLLGSQLLRAGVPGSHLEVIPNAVALPAPSALSQTHRVPALIGVAARLVESKGIQYLIAAMPTILRRHPQAHLVIAGTGTYERALRRQVARLGLGEHITFLGYVPDPLPLLSSLHVFVHPSLDDVLPTVILEAFSVGTPVVASAIASIPDTVIDGETGFLTPPGDVAGLARAVSALLDAPERASAMGNNGHRLLLRDYLLSRAGRRFAQVLRLVESQPMHAHHQDIERFSTIMLSTIRQRQLLGGSAIVLASKLLSALAMAWWTVLAARILLPTAYGDLGIALSLVQIGSYLTDAGVQTVATRELAGASTNQARGLMGALLHLKLLLGIAGVGLVIGCTSLLPFSSGVNRLVVVLSPSLIFSALGSLALVFRVRASYGYLLIIALVGAAAGGVASYAAYLYQGSAAIFAAISLGTTALTGLLTVAIVLIRFRPSLRPLPQQVVLLLRTALPLGLAAVLNIMYYRLDVPLLGLLTSSTQVAVYTSAYRFLDVLTLLPASLAAVSLPHMSALFKQGFKNLASYSQGYLDLAIIIGPTLGLMLSASARPALHLLYGGRYDVATPTLQVLAWAGAATLVTNVFTPLMIAINKSRSMVAVTLVGLTVNIGLNLLLIPRLGSLGSAYATLATEIAVIAVMAPICLRALRWRIRLATIVAVGVALPVVQWAQSRPELDGIAWPLSLLLILALWSLLIALTIAAARLARKLARTR